MNIDDLNGVARVVDEWVACDKITIAHTSEIIATMNLFANIVRINSEQSNKILQSHANIQ